MTGDEFRAAAARLGQALEAADLVVEWPELAGGNVRCWNPVPAETVLGAFLRRNWRVRFGTATEGADPAPRILALVPKTEEVDDGA